MGQNLCKYNLATAEDITNYTLKVLIKVKSFMFLEKVNWISTPNQDAGVHERISLPWQQQDENRYANMHNFYKAIEEH